MAAEAGAPVPGGRVAVVGVVTSAGGLDALTAALRQLPADFPAPVVVAQHLSGSGSQLVSILGRRLALDVVWASAGEVARPGTVHVCPARTLLEVLPDRTFGLRPGGESYRERPLDVLLHSLADNVGAGAVGVVLTGMGRDGAAGAHALQAAGGMVVVQDPETAEQSSMPAAVIEADAADLVLALDQIGPVLADLALGRRAARPREGAAVDSVFGTHGRVAELARELDWSLTPAGRVADWPPLMRTVVRLAMDSPDPTTLLWGPERLHFFNEAALATIPDRFASTFALPYREGIPESWPGLGPGLAEAERRRAGHKLEMVFSPYERGGRLREAWFDISHTAVRDVDGSVAAIQTTYFDRTREALAARRLETLNRLAELRGAQSRREAVERAVATLDGCGDVVLALAYLRDPAQRNATLAAACGVRTGGAVAPRIVTGNRPWPWTQLVTERVAMVLDDLPDRLGDHGLPCDRAVAHPLRDEGSEEITGMLVLGASARLDLDDTYRHFLAAVGETVSLRVSDAQARAREHSRAARMTEVDRAKTEFFSNVSHEFRTPLTLMLGPLAELAAHPDAPPAREDVELMARNARHLQRLVSTLLDFSQIEAGKVHASFAATDLGRLTSDVAGQFQSAAAHAGLSLTIEVDELGGPVWVDADMWEKIVSNLVSNALKFTFEGGIEVSLHALPKHAELVVRDTGVGIPADDVPLVLHRFHRVAGARARTQEGTGIGLALVDELVRRLHGRVRVASTVDVGTSVTVWVPLGRRPSAPSGGAEGGDGHEVAAAMAEAAAQWDAGRPLGEEPAAVPADGRAAATVLVVDDTRDMREYLRRLLGAHWRVVVAGDGDKALALARRDRPDLVLSDVMMPNVDGFTLVARMRQDPDLANVPVVLLTARAGEEVALEGLVAGADDYVVKPFTARDLVGRVGAQIALSRLKGRNADRDRFLLRLTDALRALADPDEVMAAAAGLLADHLHVDRVAYGEVSEAGDALVVERDHAATGTTSLVGTYRFADFPLPVAALAAGDTFVSPDVAHDVRFSAAGKRVLAAMSSATTCSVPLVKDGRFVANLNVHDSAPRAWTDDDVALVEDVAERTWAAVERARADRRLHRFQVEHGRSGHPDAEGGDAAPP